MMDKLIRRWQPVLLCLVVGGGGHFAFASDRAALRTNSGLDHRSVEALKLKHPVFTQDALAEVGPRNIAPSLVGATGRQQVIVRLKSRSVNQAKDFSQSAQRSQKFQREYEQNAFMARCLEDEPSIRVLGRVQHVLNAVFLDVPASALEAIARDPDVYRVAPVGHYEKSLSETVSYIGASGVQRSGLDGSGVRVAVLDSGVDYHHASLGGSGVVADYAANDPTIIEPGSFPTARVTGGYDFLGNVWPTGPGGFSDPPMPDPDPLDDTALEPGSFAGHGTHVADIIAGVDGVAPGAEIVGVKVCASLATSCNGISLILGMDFAVDPNGDGDTSDAVDIINMSLGSDYGQPFDDDLSTAVENASALGVLTVSSAGNCSDKPYCTGSPSSARSAVSVAQTQVPSAVLPFIEVDGTSYPSAFQAWSVAPTSLVSGTLQYADGAGGNLDGCAPFAPGSLADLVVLVDRGGCNFTLKIKNVGDAGAVAGIIGLVAPGAPFSGGDGGDRPIDIPGYMVTQADSLAMQAQIGNPGIVVIDPAQGEALVGFTVGSSARGPDMSYNAIKPEIGAPGGSVSAEVGTGTGTTPFGGTSGASPMVAGTAALLQESCRAGGVDGIPSAGDCSPMELKALIMNYGRRNISSDTTGKVAEVSRIGAGEVRADSSAKARFIAYSTDDGQPSLSLGFMDLDAPATIVRNVVVRNIGDIAQQIAIDPTYRTRSQASSGAVAVSVSPSSIDLPVGGSASFTVTFEMDPSRLSGNPMNSGSMGNNPAALTAAEYDGYILLTSSDRNRKANMPWHVLPRQAASVDAERDFLVRGGFPDSIGLLNVGAGIAQNDAFSIVALSDELPRGGQGEQAPLPDLRAVGVNTIPVPAGFCSAEDSFLWLFAINSWDRQTHLVPVSYQVGLDTDRDGVDDYLVLNRDITLTGVSDGRQVTHVVDLASGSASAFFFAEHATNTNNTVLIVCAEQMGLTGSDLLATQVDVNVQAQDFYNGGPGDFVDGITITPLGEQFLGQPSGDLAPGGAGSLDVFDFGPFPGNTPELGVLLYSNGDRGAGARGGATEDTEALIFHADPP